MCSKKTSRTKDLTHLISPLDISAQTHPLNCFTVKHFAEVFASDPVNYLVLWSEDYGFSNTSVADRAAGIEQAQNLKGSRRSVLQRLKPCTSEW